MDDRIKRALRWFWYDALSHAGKIKLLLELLFLAGIATAVGAAMYSLFLVMPWWAFYLCGVAFGAGWFVGCLRFWDWRRNVRDTRALLGTWWVESYKTEYRAAWRFAADHTVEAEFGGCREVGTWRFEPIDVLVEWRQSGRWDRLRRPCKPDGTFGSTCEPGDLIEAHKVPDEQAGHHWKRKANRPKIAH